ncbi:DNA-binding XRE family transcriptional regulator [Sporosarcina luteola]|nr:DNA-binding XRE family transcriptional regulator [Sporosarcina luteola]
MKIDYSSSNLTKKDLAEKVGGQGVTRQTIVWLEKGVLYAIAVTCDDECYGSVSGANRTNFFQAQW